MWRRIDINTRTGRTDIDGIQTLMPVAIVDIPVHQRAHGRSTRSRETAVYVKALRAFDVSVYVDGAHRVTIPPRPEI